MARLPEAEARMFQNVFVCRKCKRKIKGDRMKFLQKKLRCRKCKSKDLRPIRLKFK